MRRRDLIWSVESATPLLAQSGFPITTESTIDITKTPSLTKTHSRRLGKYFEDLIEEWLLARDEISHLHRSIQIFEKDKTLGECDFLFLRDGQPIHWEVAIKFYLLMPDGRFWGPNFSDRLDIKVNRLINHQIPIVQTKEAKRQIPREFRENVQSEVFFKGQLFYPYGAPRTIPEGINPDHEWGYWLAHGTEAYKEFLDERCSDAFQIVPKMRWLSPVQAEGVELLLPCSSLKNALEHHFSRSAISLMVARLQKVGSLWTEVERFFIIHKYYSTCKNVVP